MNAPLRLTEDVRIHTIAIEGMTCASCVGRVERALKAVDGVPYEPVINDPVADVVVNDPDYWRYIEESMSMVVHRAYNDVFREYGTA